MPLVLVVRCDVVCFSTQMNFDVGDRPRVVITRFCNISAHSRSARGVLASIAAQLEWVIANVGGGMAQKSEGLFEQAPHQMSYEALTLYLPMVMRHAGKQADIVILIDGLEECAPEHHPERNVRWIPTKLPPNVRLVVSLTGSVSPLAEPDPYAIIGQKIAAGLEACCHVIKDRIRDRFMSVKDVVEVQSMKAALKRDLTDHLLSSNNRRLSKVCIMDRIAHSARYEDKRNKFSFCTLLAPDLPASAGS